VSPPSEEAKAAYAEEERQRVAAARAGRLPPTSEGAEAANAQAEIEAIKAKVDREIAAERARPKSKKELIELRKQDAARLETVILSQVGNQRASEVHVVARGRDFKTIRVTWAGCDADVIEQLAVDRYMFEAVQDDGVNRLECTDGETTWSKTWR
jgi:hypothetical protein